MFKTSLLDFGSSGTLNKLVFDYLEKTRDLSPFYGFFPDHKGFSELLETKPYENFDRVRLAEILMAQSRLVKNTHAVTLKNIALLKNKKVFTVTTGHQLCLFTGPLYFIYKILSAINLAEALKKDFPHFDFVPVYWMASEDHDFDEIHSFNSNGKIVRWESEQKGAVGEFKTTELKNTLPQLREALGISENANYLFGLFEDAYLKHDSLSTATQYLVNELFGQYGLITLDGNDLAFKNQVKDLFKKDIFENAPAELVNESVKKLEELGYHAQVNPRKINCFYLEENARTRIEKNGNFFNLIGTDRSFTKTELEKIIDSHPDRVSPNVVLRPVYQQVILPNIAYIGGPGELAYWLEFKKMFDELNVFFPVLMPRNFLTVIDKPTANKIEQLNFTAVDFFKPEEALVKNFMIKTNHVFDLDQEKEKIRGLYSEITARTNAVDKTLSGHIGAELQKSLNKLENISLKTNRALKRNSETDINRIRSVKQNLFPGNVPQERHENFSSFYIQYGPTFFDVIKKEINPFILSHKILNEA